MPAQRFAIASSTDVGRVRHAVRGLASELGLDRQATECATLALTELATNLLRYAKAGAIEIAPVPWRENGALCGIRIECRDRGPGIADLELALQDGYSTGSGLGCGLPGVRRLMDSFAIATSAAGTSIVACKWPVHL